MTAAHTAGACCTTPRTHFVVCCRHICLWWQKFCVVCCSFYCLRVFRRIIATVINDHNGGHRETKHWQYNSSFVRRLVVALSNIDFLSKSVYICSFLRGFPCLQHIFADYMFVFVFVWRSAVVTLWFRGQLNRSLLTVEKEVAVLVSGRLRC